MGLQVPGLENQYQYGLYGKGSNIPFGGLTAGPKVNPAQPVQSETGINLLGQVGHVNDESGNKIGLGIDGVGLAHREAEGPNKFMLIA